MTDAAVAVHLKLPSKLIKNLRERNFDAAIELLQKIKERYQVYTKPAPLKSPVKGDILTASGEVVAVEDHRMEVAALTTGLQRKMQINKNSIPRQVIETRLAIKNLKEHVILEEDAFITKKIYGQINRLQEELIKNGFKP